MRAVVPGQFLEVVLLNFTGLFDDTVVGVGDGRVKEALPFGVGESDAVEAFEASAQVAGQIGFLMNRQIGVALLLEVFNERGFEVGFALVALVGLTLGLVFGHDRVLVRLGDDIKV